MENNNFMKPIIIIEAMIILILILTMQPISLLDRLNMQGADIEPYDNYFRFSIVDSSGDKLYVSKNVSWNYLVANSFIVDGEVNCDESFWNSYLIRKNIVIKHYIWNIFSGWHWYYNINEYQVILEVYY